MLLLFNVGHAHQGRSNWQKVIQTYSESYLLHVILHVILHMPSAIDWVSVVLEEQNSISIPLSKWIKKQGGKLKWVEL